MEVDVDRVYLGFSTWPGGLHLFTIYRVYIGFSTCELAAVLEVDGGQ